MFKKVLDYLHFFKALYLLAHNKQIFCSWEDKTPFDFSFEQLTMNQNFFFDSLPQKLEKLVHGLDQKSKDVIWMHIVASVRYQTMRRSPFFFDLYNFFDKENRKMIKRSPRLPEMEAQKLHVPAEIFTEYSSVYFHHSLKFAPRSVLDYIEGKIFIDAGAYHGDSSLILSRYNPSKIYAFEISKYNIQVMEDILSKSSVPDNLVSIIPMGLGNSE